MTQIALIEQNIWKREGFFHFLSRHEYIIQHQFSTISSLKETIDAQQYIENIDIFIIGSQENQIPLQDMLQFIQDSFPGASILLLAETIDCSLILEAYGNGADGVLKEDASSDVFIECLRLIQLGEKYFPSNTLDVLEEKLRACASPGNNAQNGHSDDGMPRLSTREIEILRYVAHGATNKQIARDFDISEGTVKTHVKHILRTIGVRNRTQAASWAHRNGLSSKDWQLYSAMNPGPFDIKAAQAKPLSPRISE